MVSFPETEVATYQQWNRMLRGARTLSEQTSWANQTLQALQGLLYYVRSMSIVGLDIKGIRAACFVPFDVAFNRHAWLLLNEIKAYNTGQVDEFELARQWTLSGLERP
jgi:hypothetical protein